MSFLLDLIQFVKMIPNMYCDNIFLFIDIIKLKCLEIEMLDSQGHNPIAVCNSTIGKISCDWMQ